MATKIRLAVVSATVVIFLAFVLHAVYAPTPIFMDIPDIPGGVMQVGLEDTSELIELDHLIIQNIDPSTGLPSGRIQHQPITVTKEIDRATVALHERMTSNQKISTMKLLWFRNNRTGEEEGYFEITLTNAYVVSMETIVPLTLIPENVVLGHMERVSFIYETIEWIWIPDGNPPPPSPADGDADGNGRVDLRDYAVFERCRPATVANLPPCLESFDFNADGSITLSDHLGFTQHLTGP